MIRKEPVASPAKLSTGHQRGSGSARVKNTWSQTVEEKLKTLQHTWVTVQKLAKNRLKSGVLFLLRFV